MNGTSEVSMRRHGLQRHGGERWAIGCIGGRRTAPTDNAAVWQRIVLGLAALLLLGFGWLSFYVGDFIGGFRGWGLRSLLVELIFGAIFVVATVRLLVTLACLVLFGGGRPHRWSPFDLVGFRALYLLRIAACRAKPPKAPSNQTGLQIPVWRAGGRVIWAAAELGVIVSGRPTYHPRLAGDRWWPPPSGWPGIRPRPPTLRAACAGPEACGMPVRPVQWVLIMTPTSASMTATGTSFGHGSSAAKVWTKPTVCDRCCRRRVPSTQSCLESKG